MSLLNLKWKKFKENPPEERKIVFKHEDGTYCKGVVSCKDMTTEINGVYVDADEFIPASCIIEYVSYEDFIDAGIHELNNPFQHLKFSLVLRIKD